VSSRNAISVVEHRQRRKILATQAFGGFCGICGYNKCPQVLEFHHLDPDCKEFSISTSGSGRSWDKTVEELRKCVCLCSNCHREVHADVTKIPNTIRRFDESFATIKLPPKPKKPCQTCKKPTTITNKYCSIKCAQKDREKIKWPSDGELTQRVKESNFCAVARDLGVSDNAIRKRLKRKNNK
jgi:hypothetical protein